MCDFVKDSLVWSGDVFGILLTSSVIFCLKWSRATSSYLSLIYFSIFNMWESSCSPFLEECFSVLFQKICEGVLKVMFIGVPMLSSKMLLNYILLISITIFQLKIYQDATKLFR